MTAETYSAPLVSQLSVSGQAHVPQGYYRSKLFTASFSTNPLIAASGPLLSLLERLNISTSLPAITHIRDNIQHELYAFQSRLHSQEQPEEIILISHYLICATIDELLGKAYTKVHGESTTFKAFTPPSLDEADPQQRFFEIIHYIKERAHQYLDLLEFAYYCLIAGFEGEYHFKADGRQALDNLIDEIYLSIQQHRAHKEYKLFKPHTPSVHVKKSIKPFISMIATTVGVLAVFYLLSHTLLEQKARSVLQSHQTLAYLEN